MLIFNNYQYCPVLLYIYVSLLSNANITRYGIISSWNSNWVESNILYSSIIYTDIYINQFLNGLYYKFKMPTTLPIIKNIGYNKTFIFVDSLVFHKEGRFHKWPQYYRNAFDMKCQTRHIFFHIKRACKYIKYYINTNIYNFKYFIYSSKILMNKLLYIINKKKFKLPYLNKNMNINIKYYKKLNKNLFKKNKLEKYKKKLLKKYNINYSKYKLKKKQNASNNKFFYIKKLNSISNIYINKFKKKINNISYKKLNTTINNKYKYLYNRYRLYQLIKYKNKINNITSNKFIKRNSITYILNRIKNKHKYGNKINISNINYLLNNINNILYSLLLSKLFIFLVYIYRCILLSYILNNIESKIIKTISFIINKVIYNVKNINNTNNIRLSTSFIFNNKIQTTLNKINIVNKNKKYNRIRSQFRLKKKTEKLNKEKKYNMFRRVVMYQHYLKFICDSPKYTSKIIINMLHKQLCLKINETLNIYIHNYIYYIHNYNILYLNRINNPKLLSDYIKILMKYEEKNPTILKRIVKMHSAQKYKSKVFTRRYIKKSHILIKKINIKLQNYIYNMHYKYIKKRNIKKRNIIEIMRTAKSNKYIKSKISSVIYKKKYNSNHTYMVKYNNYIKLNTNKQNSIKNVNIYIENINTNNIYNKMFIVIYNLNKWLHNIKLLTYKKYPLIGMRIELSGPTKKGRRTQTHLYNEWVDTYTLPGKMQLVKIINDIKYWQDYGLTQRASIGIKVWMHFHTIRYSEQRKYIIE